jgi:TRAP-type C4-dicarboxylate transport system permease small subunit
MKALDSVVRRLSAVLNLAAGIALSFMMMITVVDVAMRAMGRPFIGTYEIVGLTLALVIGLAIPQVSLDGAHVYMEFGLDRLSGRGKRLMMTFTRLLCIVLFVFVGYNLISVGTEFRVSGEVSPTLQLPFFPVAYAVGICCFLQCFVFILGIATLWRDRHE